MEQNIIRESGQILFKYWPENMSQPTTSTLTAELEHFKSKIGTKIEKEQNLSFFCPPWRFYLSSPFLGWTIPASPQQTVRLYNFGYCIIYNRKNRQLHLSCHTSIFLVREDRERPWPYWILQFGSFLLAFQQKCFSLSF